MKEKGKLTKKQQEIYEFIKSEIIQRGYPPSVRDICSAVQLKSTSSVHAHLQTLESLGYIRRDPAKSRTIEITDEHFYAGYRRDIQNVPMVGTVTAGNPILAIQETTEYFPIPAEYLPNQDTFLLKVKGESMINAGILDGDYVLVEKQSTARDGDMVVALLGDSATVKTFYREQGHFRLQPENDYMEPIIVEDASILGRVIGVIRLFQ